MDGRGQVSGEYFKTSCSQVATNGVRISRTAEMQLGLETGRFTGSGITDSG